MNLRDAAVANNAAWCAAVCATHGIEGAWSPAAWTSPRRTPDLYPDAVTLTPGATAADLAGRVDAGPGCSVKDSYASLHVPGMRVLFEATWIAAPAGPAGPPPGLDWDRTADVEEWAAAWMAASGADAHPFAAATPDADFHAGRDATGRIVAGVVAFRTGDVVGVSNVFGAEEAWRAVRHVVRPALPIVGYESGADLDLARAAGFHPTGRLRVLYTPTAQ